MYFKSVRAMTLDLFGHFTIMIVCVSVQILNLDVRDFRRVKGTLILNA